MKNIKILIVDNPLIALDLLDRIEHLQELGKFAQVSSLDFVDHITGQEAIKHFERDQPDIAFIEVGVGANIEGVHTAMAIREKSNLPIIFLVFDQQQVDETRKVSEPIFHLEKPFLMRQIDRAMNSALISLNNS
ncbi:MAG: hypothetical protein AAF734_01185 [Bacteroidota bacterium]